jgi:dihydrofolate synthase / folylpolyglutamate synthase
VSDSNLSYKEALTWLYGLQRFGIKLGLENMHRLIEQSDLDLPGTCVVHVAGTNGKGSVCAMIDAITRAAGHRTGLFISPHLVTFRERIRVNNEMIPAQAVAAGVAELRDQVSHWPVHPTFFEIVTALALKYFKAEGCSIVVLETGLGGRLDATNAITSNVSVITPIGLDHQKLLGESLPEIAREKAGIIRHGVPVVSGPQRDEARTVIEARASECGAPLSIVMEPYTASPIALRGQHQQHNAALATAAIRAAAIEVDSASVARGLASVEWPARFQRWDSQTIIDGAHNPAAAEVLVQTWRDVFGEQRATIVLAVLSDKDARAIVEILLPIAACFVFPQIRSERALPPDALAEILFALSPKSQYSVTASVAAAVVAARERSDPVLITGSLHFAGEALAWLEDRPGAFEECNQ